MRLLTNLTAKMLLVITLVALIAGYIIVSLNIKQQKKYVSSVFKQNEDFLHNILVQVQDNALRKEYQRHRETLTTLSDIYLSVQESKGEEKFVIEMLDFALSSRGMIAITVLDSDNKIAITMYKKNGNIIHTEKEIPKFISNDKNLTLGESLGVNGTLVGFFDEKEFIAGVIDSSEIFLEDFNFFAEELRDLEQEVSEYKPISFILFTLILTLTTFVAIKVMVSSPLNKIKKGLNSFFSSLDNSTNDNIKKIKINTKDEFEDMAKSLNSQISIGINLHRELDKAQRKMQDAISHSSIIQQSLISNNSLMDDFFDDFFIHWQPRDIVGGDIYFFDKINNDECIIMCIDCTGHSVYGALITVLVKAIHFQIIEDVKNGFIKKDSPSQMLSYFNKRIKLILDQHDNNSNSNIGFDGGIIHYNKKNKLIKYSGARTPLLYIDDKNDNINIVKSDEYSTGYKNCNINYEYKEDTIKTHTNMKFYIATDGFMDQIGEKSNMRFGKSRFYKMLKQHHGSSFAEQKKIYEQELNHYQGSFETVDDITFIGFKI